MLIAKLERADPIENHQKPLISSEQQHYHAVFVGNAREYFRIWVVNMLFSLLTLGIWSAWATVRNRRYLYGNTEFAGNCLDFHGNPLAILRGRILAVVLFSAYALGGDLYFAIPAVALFLLIVLFPWILTSAMRFRLSNTSWRNLRFGFSATTKSAYSLLGFPMLLVLISYMLFYLQFQWLNVDQSDMASLQMYGLASLFFLLISFILVPLAIHRIQHTVMNHTRYGEHNFTTKIRLLRFLGFYGKSFTAALIAITLNYLAVFLIFTVLGGKSAVLSAVASGSYGFMALVYFLMIPAYLFPFAVWKVATANYVLGSTQIEGLQFKMDMKVWHFWWILVSNAYLAVISLGLAIPWTKVRMIRYKLSCLSASGEMQVYRGSNVGRQSATGDEIGQAFDIDFGF